MHAQFGILGPIEVRGRSDLVPRGRTLSLLALLLVHRGATVPVDRIVDELWEAGSPEHGRKAVQVVASRLRRAVGEVVSEGGGYALQIAPGEVDAERFEALLRRGHDELARGEAAEAAATLRQAVALWRGPALADVGHKRFAQPEIARLEGLRLAALGDRIDADLICGRHVELASELEALVAEHPLHERLRGQQMLALYRSGRPADALSAYRDAYEALVDGLGIEPSPELRELEAAILHHDVPAPPPGRQPTPLAVDARRLVTCVFAQLTHAGFYPESLRAVLERYHATARMVCAAHGGIVAELRNDAVLAVFGSPVAHEDDPQRALRAAVELVASAAHSHRAAGCAPARWSPPGAAPVIGEAVGAAERLARSAASGEIRMDGSTWRLVRHGAQATEVEGGDFLLLDLDADAPAIRRRLDRPLIGREEQVARLRAAFEQVVATRTPDLVAILGPAGIGKSRLAAELGIIAGDAGRVLIGRCPAYESTAYSPLREIVLQTRDLAATLDVAPAVARQVTLGVGLEQGTASEDTGWAVVRLIDALARAQPLVVVIDDAHHAQPALIDLLHDVGRLRDAPALIVCAARHELTDSPPAWAQHVLELGPLSDPASATLLAAIADGRLDPAQERQIADAASGNPLFLEQLVAYVDEHRGADSLPPALHSLLAARLDRLDAAERSALALGAVAGDSFATTAVHALAGGITPRRSRPGRRPLAPTRSARRGRRLAAVSARARPRSRLRVAREVRARPSPRALCRLARARGCPGRRRADRVPSRDRVPVRGPDRRRVAAAELVARAGRRLAAAAPRVARAPRRPVERDRIPRAVARAAVAQTRRRARRSCPRWCRRSSRPGSTVRGRGARPPRRRGERRARAPARRRARRD